MDHRAGKARRAAFIGVLFLLLLRAAFALGEVSVQVVFEGVPVSAKGSDTDIVTASAKAYLNALNRHLFQKTAP